MNEFYITIKKKRFIIKIVDDSKIIINNKEFPYEFENRGENHFLKINNKSYNIFLAGNNGDKILLNINGESLETEIRSSVKEKAKKLLEQKGTKKHNLEIKAPMPGLIHNIKKKKGEAVRAGEAVLILEAMKMENEIRTPSDGVIKEIKVSEGDKVEKGSSLFILE